jgi:hypothetical protein
MLVFDAGLWKFGLKESFFWCNEKVQCSWQKKLAKFKKSFAPAFCEKK